MLGGQVEIVHGARDIEIAVGVEAVDEGGALVAQIALHLEVGVEAEGLGREILQAAPKLTVQGLFRKIGDVRRHARHGKAIARHLAEFQISPLAPVRVGHHGLAADFVKGDVLRGVPRCRRDRDRREHALGVARHPLEHLHAAHRSADHAEQLINAEPVDQAHLRIDHVADGDDRKLEPPGAAGIGIEARRPRRTHAAAENVGADDEEAVCVDRLARPDHGFPPAGLARHGLLAGNVLIEG
jgi:hypothetical protein